MCGLDFDSTAVVLYLSTDFQLNIISIEMYGNDTGSLAEALFCSQVQFFALIQLNMKYVENF